MVRSDARENRARILETARRALAEDGDTSMNQIAQRAGVGPGTLYRNFPTREALVLAVYQLDVDQLVESVPGLLAALPPLEALRRWTTDLVSAMRRKHGLGDALSPGAHRSIIQQTYGPVIAAITQLLDACLVAEAVALPIDSVTSTGEVAVTPEKLTIAAGTLDAGTVAGLRMAEMTPGYTANRAVNAGPYLC